jgi:hypothetical protein
MMEEILLFYNRSILFLNFSILDSDLFIEYLPFILNASPVPIVSIIITDVVPALPPELIPKEAAST